MPISIFGGVNLLAEFNLMENPELEKSIAHITVEIIEYVPNAVVIKTILKKSTGNISVMSFDVGEGLTEKISPFDTFAQIIEGKAEIIIAGNSNFLFTGGSIRPVGRMTCSAKTPCCVSSTATSSQPTTS